MSGGPTAGAAVWVQIEPAGEGGGGGYDAIGDVMTVLVPASLDPDLTCASLVISAEVDVTAGQSLKLVATAKSGNADCTVRAGGKLLVKGIGS